LFTVKLAPFFVGVAFLEFPVGLVQLILFIWAAVCKAFGCASGLRSFWFYELGLRGSLFVGLFIW
jgi:hypothetical protein